MFDWFWEFLYSLTAGMCKLIDGVMTCANKLCGIDTIKVDGEETDFLTYLFRSEEIRLAFVVAAIIGLILVVFFSIYAILRNVAKGRVDESPTRVCMKALKAILTFMLVPACMLVLMWSLNIIMGVLYKATLAGSSAGIGTYLVGAFSKEGVQLPEGVDYTNASRMWDYFNLKNYQYFFSWISCFVILVQTAKALILFVDRAISIVVLYVVSPFSISASVIDDGSHFKLWRDQILVKFLNGYGTIIALNIYAMICALVARPEVEFFDNDFINFLMKVLVIVGGAFSLQRIMGLIGNLVSAGAGTQEMQQAAMANAGMKGLLGGIGNAAATVTGLKTAKDIGRGAISSMKNNASNKLAKKLMPDLKEPDPQESFRNNVLQNLTSITQSLNALGGSGNTAKDAIAGKKDDNKDKDNMVKDAITGGDNKENDNGNHNPIGDMIGGGSDDTLRSSSASAAPTE